MTIERKCADNIGAATREDAQRFCDSERGGELMAKRPKQPAFPEPAMTPEPSLRAIQGGDPANDEVKMLPSIGLPDADLALGLVFDSLKGENNEGSSVLAQQQGSLGREPGGATTRTRKARRLTLIANRKEL